MKKLKIVLAVVAAVIVMMFVVGLTSVGTNDGKTNYANYNRDKILALIDEGALTSYDPDVVYKGDDVTGVDDKVMGEVGVPIVVFEYADFLCSHCADWNEVLEEKIEGEWKGKVAIIFREFLRTEYSIKPSAANSAAYLQGYGAEFKNLLYENQASWASLDGRNLQNAFEEYLTEASEGQADLVQFREDMQSEKVAKRLAFNYRMAEATDIEGTPYFRIDGKKVELASLLEVIEGKIAEL